MAKKNELGYVSDDPTWRYEEDGLTVTRTCGWSAPGCHPVGCGMKLYTDKEGNLVRVEGDEDHPINQGSLCIRCLTMKEYLNNKDRVKHPMKRAKADRGKDTWERISWDEALDIIEENVKNVTEKYGAESILYLTGTGRQASQAALLMAWADFETPNVGYVLSGFSCYGPRVAVTNYALGAPYPEVDYASNFPDRYDNPEYEFPKYVLVWGKEPLKSNPDGFWGHSIIDMMRHGTKLIVVDPRLNYLSAHAEYWLQIRPGTDAALALGMLNVIINEDLYDHEFVEKWCYGFDELKERVQEYPPELVAQICWIDEEMIKGAARAFATNSPSALSWGVALDQCPNSLQQCHALLALIAITGNIDVPGGCTLGDPWHFGDMGASLDPEVMEKQIGLDTYPAICRTLMFAHPDMLLETLESDEPYPLRMVWIQSTNPLANTTCVPDRWHRAFERAEFVGATDLFITPTIQATADLFLPIAGFAEADGYVACHYGGSGTYFGCINKALDGGEALSDMEIAMKIGKRLHPEKWPWKDMKEYYTEVTLKPLGITFEELQEMGVVQKPGKYRKYETGELAGGTPGFMTPTHMVELYATMFDAWGEDPLPYYFEPPMSPYSTPEQAEKYPFVLTTGARTWSYFHSEGRQVPSLRQIEPNPICEINSRNAAELGIADGDWVVIENDLGKCKQKAYVTDGIPYNVIHCQHGWWFPEEGPENLFDTYKSNVNLLVPHHKLGRLGFGAPFKCLIANVSKAEETEMEGCTNE